ncbi:unnamed protein product, partial [Brachionus calyciflorus]
NLRKRLCPISEGCRERGDLIGKKNSNEVSSDELANNLSIFFKTAIKVGDIICMKHYMQYYVNRCPKKLVLNKSNSESFLTSSETIIGDSNEDFENQIDKIPNTRTAESTSASTLETNEYENTMSINENTNYEIVDSDKTVLRIKRGFGSHGFCFICKRKTGSKPMTVLPIQAIVEIYIRREILIPLGARSCSDHLSENNYVKEDQIENIPIADISIGITSEKI